MVCWCGQGGRGYNRLQTVVSELSIRRQGAGEGSLERERGGREGGGRGVHLGWWTGMPVKTWKQPEDCLVSEPAASCSRRGWGLFKHFL